MMKRISNGALLAMAGVLLLVAAFTFVSAGPVSGAGVRSAPAASVHPDKKSKSCDKSDGYCLEVINESQSDSGGVYASGSYGVVAAGEYPLYSEGTDGVAYTDLDGDGYFEGYVEASTYYTDAATRGGGHVRASMALAPRPTIEDSGTARMTSGEGVVRFSQDFARTIDMSKGYQVFLTPDGDTRGLYVSQKYERGFIVRESERGRSTLEFDYRILAHPIGATDARFPAVHEMVPRPPIGR